jgi:serine/threonine-protein kinase SRPK3
MIGDLLHNRYRIVDKLGYGGYSTIWLAHNEKVKRYVAFKIGIAKYSTHRREIKVLGARHMSRSNSHAPAGCDVNACKALLSVLDAFDIYGLNRTHITSHADFRLRESQGSLIQSSLSSSSRPRFSCRISN